MGRMMVEIPIPPKWKQLWDAWDLRGFIILSLSLQTFLILFAPLRKRTKSNWIIMPLWSAYFLADWAANFAIGLISSSQLGNPSVSSGKDGGGNAVRNEDLLAFWAPFLLVHLGGPETITAFALEDNELWRRHLLGLVLQCLATVYVFVQSLPQNRLWIPTMLMFMTGIMKYAERTHSFYLASADRFKDSVPQEADLHMDRVLVDYDKKKNLTELEVVQYGYWFFKKCKVLVVGMGFNWFRRDQVQTQVFFMNRTAKDAFKVVEVELNIIYEVLYTKLPVVYRRFGAMNRSFSLATICSAIVLFIFKNKSNLSSADVTITYVLLFGALALDIIALFMLLFSDWTIISLRGWPDDELDNSIKTRIVTAFLTLMTECTIRDPKDDALPNTSRWPIRVFKRRWSESISTFNLIDYCLHPRSSFEQFLYENLGSSGFLDDMKYVKTKKFTPELRDFIWKEIKLRLELTDKSLRMDMDMYSQRGEWVLGKEVGGRWMSLIPLVHDLDYDQSILVWHIATELCYNNEPKSKTPVKDHREIAKLLSDYMLYLLIMQPNYVLAVTGTGQKEFQANCHKAKLIFIDEEANEERKQTLEPGDKEMACSKIRAFQPRLYSKYLPEKLLCDGSCLAKKLEEREEEYNGLDKWLIISKVWVELLCYGAIHSRANTHAAQTSRGGELITIIWLLMSHLALDGTFKPNDGIN